MSTMAGTYTVELRCVDNLDEADSVYRFYEDGRRSLAEVGNWIDWVISRETVRRWIQERLLHAAHFVLRGTGEKSALRLPPFVMANLATNLTGKRPVLSQWHKRALVISKILVAPEYQHIPRIAATFAMPVLERHAVSLGFSHAGLDHRTDISSFHSYFASLGYEEVGTDHLDGKNGPVELTVRMKELASR